MKPHVLRAVDEQLALNAFFHASHTPLPVGEELVHHEAVSPRGAVDRHRPDGVPRRWDHFFMVDDRGLPCLPELGQSPGQHLYRVVPTAPVIAADYGWLEDSGDKDASEERVRKYWSGEPSSVPCRREYLTRSFRVEEDLGVLLPPGLKLYSHNKYATRNAELSGVMADRVDFGEDTVLWRADFSDASLRGAKFVGNDLTGANFQGADLGGASLTYAKLNEANLRDVDLMTTRLRGADLLDADLRGARLPAEVDTVKFHGARRLESDAPVPGWVLVNGRLEQDVSAARATPWWRAMLG